MSRIGLKPIEIPEGVEVKINGNHVSVTGPKGELSRSINSEMTVEMKDNVLTVARPTEGKKHRSLHGTTRSIIANMIQGVNTGFEKSLEINGVGYRAQMQGDKLVVNAGYSHPVEMEPESEIDIEVPKNTQIIVKGIDRERVGAVAANIRSIRPPEPYKGKGIRYAGEQVTQKVGKTAK